LQKSNLQMSATLSSWGKEFESRFLEKLEICGIFCCIPQKLCFLTTPVKRLFWV
jgi:hypothetical protein